MNNDTKKAKLTDAIISASGGKIGKEDINAAASGDIGGIMKNLSEQDKKKLLGALSDENAAKQMLSSDAAKKLLDSLFGGNK